MSSSKRDFERFIAWLHAPERQASPDVKRLANLALAHFDGLARTALQRSQRSIFLVGKAREELALTPDALPVIEPVEADAVWPFKRLRAMTVGPFRGFRAPEPFDLHNRIVLLYGPNGSGKTSFCEALEFALLGSVEDAESKRIDGRAYLVNLHARRFDPPVLTATDHQNREVAVVPNADTFRFCFIEKNRIEAFARIAARPPAQRTELIATLFGMEKFNEFVSHFNESVDGQLVTIAAKQLELNGKRKALAEDQAMVNGEAQSLEVLAADESAIAARYLGGVTYDELKAFIGTADSPGRIQELDAIIAALPPAAIGITRDGLLAAFEALHTAHEELTAIAAKLDARSNQVSFKDLYTAVISLEVTHGDRCPACDTPIDGVKSNPFKRAAAGLDALKDLGELQDLRVAAQTNIANASRELRRQLGCLSAFLAANEIQASPVSRFLAGLDAEPAGTWWAPIYPAKPPHEVQPLDVVTLESVLQVADRIAAQDSAADVARQTRQQHVDERAALVALQLDIRTQDLKRTLFVDSITAARERIAAFDANNAPLIADVEQEALHLARDARIRLAYTPFLQLLREYRNELPGMLLAGLNETAMNLYNEFNRNDLDADKLAALHLPLNGDQKIEIAFRGNPDVRVDALRILSEGHIRCLGLAILLAKTKSIQSPLVVFDDVINAIDNDHRGGIRETIFESDHFNDSQLIVTCHSNEFIKDIQQHLPAGHRADCKIYLFRHHTGDYQPRVTGNVSIKSSIAKARSSVDHLDHRDALAASRQALEILSEKVWRWLGSHELGVLNLQLAGVGAEPGLRNLCDALRKRLDDAAHFDHPNKMKLLSAYGRILGIPAANLIWMYLNKGTHEQADRDDFDGELVECVVQMLEEVDALDLRPGR